MRDGCEECVSVTEHGFSTVLASSSPPVEDPVGRPWGVVRWCIVWWMGKGTRRVLRASCALQSVAGGRSDGGRGFVEGEVEFCPTLFTRHSLCAVSAGGHITRPS